MSKWHGGKGSKQRPTDRKKYEENYERIFRKKQKSNSRNESENDEWDFPFHEPIPEKNKETI